MSPSTSISLVDTSSFNVAFSSTLKLSVTATGKSSSACIEMVIFPVVVVPSLSN